METQTVDAENFVGLLGIVGQAVKPSHPIVAYRHVCFRGETMLGFDGEVGVVAKSPIMVHGCLPFATLAKWVRMASGQIQVSQNRNKVKLRAPGLETSLLAADVDSFPDFLPREVKPLGEVPDLADAVREVLFSSESKAANKPFGVGIWEKHAYSTDGHRFTRHAIQGYVRQQIVLPSRAAKIVAAIGNPQAVGATEGSLVLSYGAGTALVLGMSSQKFPFDLINRAFDGKHPSQIIAFPDTFAHAIEPVCAMAEEGDGGLDLKADGKLLAVSARCAEVGESRAEIPLVSPAFHFRVSARYLQDGLKRSTQIDLGDFLAGSQKCIRFVGAAGLDHMVAMMH